jgi:ribosome-binding protein aMBF1 (putative translation factor)
MIKNERQYLVTKAEAEKFAKALQDAEARSYSDPLLAQLERDSLRSQLEELRSDLEEYDRLRSGQVTDINVESFDQFPKALIQARIASGLSQKDLADRLALKEQQIQRYEATDYSAAGLARIMEVVKALKSNIKLTVKVMSAAPSASVFFKNLKQAGVAKDLVTKRLIRPAMAAQLESADPNEAEHALLHASGVVTRVYGWPEKDLFSKSKLSMPKAAAGLARFKLPVRANETFLIGYVVYAHYLAGLVLKASPTLTAKVVPTDAGDFRRQLLAKYRELTFDTLLRFAWDLGVVVLPLRDSGAFHGAAWRILGRNVVVLKQRTNSLARWLIDLLHELFHAGQEPEKPEREVIEDDEMSAERRESEEEQLAVKFSGDVPLNGRCEELVQECVQAAGGRVERLKAAVPRIAEQRGVPADVLANCLAFRLSMQKVNWWGAATNLQPQGNDPWGIARDWLLPKLSLDKLDETDRELLLHALTTGEDS